MKIKLDENLSRHLAGPIEQEGHEVATAADEGLLGKPDAAVASASVREGRMLLTLDLEFGDLRKFPPGDHPGIVLFRPRRMSPLSVNRFVSFFVRNTDLEELAGCVTVVEPGRLRIRRPSIDRD